MREVVAREIGPVTVPGLSSYSFTYYPESGGVVIERLFKVYDAGLIREPGVQMTEWEVRQWAKGWFTKRERLGGWR